MSFSTQNKFDLLSKGKIIENKTIISEASKAKFTFAKEPGAFPSWIPSCNPGTKFEVEEVNFMPGAKWVKIRPANTHGISFKITAEEFSWNFILI